jgi:hypothetical protein
MSDVDVVAAIRAAADVLSVYQELTVDDAASDLEELALEVGFEPASSVEAKVFARCLGAGINGRK